jgi:predicted small secreted protein
MNPQRRLLVVFVLAGAILLACSTASLFGGDPTAAPKMVQEDLE